MEAKSPSLDVIDFPNVSCGSDDAEQEWRQALSFVSPALIHSATGTPHAFELPLQPHISRFSTHRPDQTTKKSFLVIFNSFFQYFNDLNRATIKKPSLGAKFENASEPMDARRPILRMMTKTFSATSLPGIARGVTMNKYVAALLGMVALVASGSSLAQLAENPLPKATISIVVPLAPGGPADVIARVLASKLSARVGRTVIVDNRAGAGGNIGAAYVAHAPADGSTWLYTVDSVMTTNPWMYASQGFDPTKDLIPVARVEDVLLMLAVNAKSVPAKSWAELVDLSKKRPLTFGSAGVGSPGHLALEYLKSVSPIQASHVPYRGAALAMQDLLSGQIDATFIVAGVLVPHVKSGALRALAVSANARIEALPDVPSAMEAGITGFEARFSNLFLAPAGTPKNIRDFMAAQIAPILADPDVRSKFDAMAETPTERHDEQDASAWVKQERERWGRVIKASGIKAE